MSINGNTGEVLAGGQPLAPPAMSDDLATFMDWVDEKRKASSKRLRQRFTEAQAKGHDRGRGADLGVFDAATGAVLVEFSIDMDVGVGFQNPPWVDFVGFAGDCGDDDTFTCHILVVSSTVNTPTFANNLNYYDILTLDASDSRCQPTPAPHHSDGATALAAGLAVPALAALAL